MAEPTEDKKKQAEKPLEKMTVKELKEIVLQLPDIKGVHGMKKDELLATVKQARGVKDEEPAKKRKPKKRAPGPMTVLDMKKKIRQLREEKEALRTTADRKQRDILRRRINRLKKRTRKAA